MSDDDLAVAAEHFRASIDGDQERLHQAISSAARVAEERAATLGAIHPDTLLALTRQAFYASYARQDVTVLRSRIIAGWEEYIATLNADAPETQKARNHLAGELRIVGRKQDAALLTQQIHESWRRIAADCASRLGPTHPDTIDARRTYAYSHRWVGRPQGEEVALMEGIVAELEVALGTIHPRTLRAKVDLAFRYYEGAYDVGQAIVLGERIIDDVHANLDESDLRTLRAVLISAYGTTGRENEMHALAARYPMPHDDQ